jgi:DNA-binding HxlR family transcriptional regulator
MRYNRSGPLFLTAERTRILEAVSEHGQLTMPEIPHSWPCTRPMMEVMVREMVALGILAERSSGSIRWQTAYSLTGEGENVLKAALAQMPQERLAS